MARYCTYLLIDKFSFGFSERRISQIDLNVEHFLGITTDVLQFCAASSSIPKLCPVRDHRHRRRRRSRRRVEEEESDASEESDESEEESEDEIDDDDDDDSDDDEETHIHHCL